MAEKNDRPVKKFQSGAIEVAVWKRTNDHGTFYNASASRSFKREEQSEWERTSNFGRDDLPVVTALQQLAFAWIIATEAKEREARRDTDPTNPN